MGAVGWGETYLGERDAVRRVLAEAPEPRSLRGSRGALYRWNLALLAALVLSCLVALKWTVLRNETSRSLFLVYSLVVTSFFLSRFVAAMLHRRTMNACYAASDAAYCPHVSFVIPCMNEEDAIGTTVRACFAAEYPSDKIEVIVIDDGSIDGTAAALVDLQRAYPHLQVVSWSVNRGKRHGVAEGFRRATGEIVILLDSDSYIEPADVRQLVEPFANPEIGAVCAHADPANADANLLTRMQAAYYFLSFRLYKAAESSSLTVLCCSGCSSAYRRSVILPVIDEWLAERFLGRPMTWGDDRALTNWVLRCGLQTIYTDRVQAYTICPDTLHTLLKQQIRWKKGWFVNSLRVAPFVLRRYPFVAVSYFLPLVVLTVATPVMAVRGLLWMPVVDHTTPTYYLAGAAATASLSAIYCRSVGRENRYWRYVFLWSLFSMFVVSLVLFYALATIQNRAWGTRSTRARMSVWPADEPSAAVAGREQALPPWAVAAWSPFHAPSVR
jgi:hyaluronan synthase